MNTLPILVGALCVYALAYRYYSAWIAAKAMALDDRRTTPSHVLEDRHNCVPSPKWVLFGHNFAIAGAGPLVGPTLAAQFGFAPGFGERQ
jgi:carbon starvation protein